MALANKLAKHIQLPQIILLYGELGAGKTTFVQSIAKSLGVKDPVTSPTFSIHNQYEFTNGVIDHFDLYRVQSDPIVTQQVFECMQNTKSLTIVEWADYLTLPQDDSLTITFRHSSVNKREIEFSAKGEKSQKLLSVLQ